jgi:DNA-binding NarL/FixJ family response regulator
MPKVEGVETTKWIVRDYPDLAVLLRTMFHEDALVAEALRAWPRTGISRMEMLRWG